MAAIPADPWSAGLMAAGGIAQAAMQKPAMTTAATFGASTFDNSGWNINIAGEGASVTSSASNDRTALPSASSLLKNPLVLIVLAVAAYYYLGRK